MGTAWPFCPERAGGGLKRCKFGFAELFATLTFGCIAVTFEAAPADGGAVLVGVGYVLLVMGGGGPRFEDIIGGGAP